MKTTTRLKPLTEKMESDSNLRQRLAWGKIRKQYKKALDAGSSFAEAVEIQQRLQSRFHSQEYKRLQILGVWP